MVRLENEWLSIGFDSHTGALESLVAKAGGREFMRRSTVSGPFGIWADFFAPYLFAYDDRAYEGIFYSAKVLPQDPRLIARNCLRPSEDVRIEAGGDRLALQWRFGDLEVDIAVSLADWTSRWAMTVTNRGAATVSILPVFPWIEGIDLSAETGQMVALNQAGYIADIWAHEGGAYGNCFHSSAQFGCLFEPDTSDALGFWIEDASFGAKDIRYVRPGIQVRWFPDRELAPGASIALPETVIAAYRGSWKRTARAYGEWFRRAPRPDPTPDWILGNDGYQGAWTEKKGKPYGETIGLAMDSFEELPVGHIGNTAETMEYAFYCSGSMDPAPPTKVRLMGSNPYRHTDGWNIPRSDLGGVDALREGVEGVHRNGKRVTLYVEALIVPEESVLFENIPAARSWLVHNPDGGNFGPYTHTGFVHMCPGCAEWQDHIAVMCERLVRETGVDGIRLDSLNFYFWPCYNPAHKHASPFDYNDWVRQLYAKVADATKAVKSDVLLAVEGPSDLVNVRFNVGLHQLVGDQMAHVARDTAPLRVALPDFVIVQWTGGGIAQTLRLLPDGQGHAGDSEQARLAAKWFPVHQAVRHTLRRGDAATPNPISSSPDMSCRWVRGEGEDVILGVRHEPATGEHDPLLLKTDRVRSMITVPLGYEPSAIYLYDVERQATAAIPYAQDTRGVTFVTDANWFAAIAYPDGGDLPMLLIGDGDVKPGGEVSLFIDAPVARGAIPEVAVEPIGMAGASSVRALANESFTVTVPPDTFPGYYWVRATGKRLRQTARTIRVVE